MSQFPEAALEIFFWENSIKWLIIWRFSSRVKILAWYTTLKKKNNYMKNFMPDWKYFNPGWNMISLE